jgi:hypothetical protein
VTVTCNFCFYKFVMLLLPHKIERLLIRHSFKVIVIKFIIQVMVQVNLLSHGAVFIFSVDSSRIESFKCLFDLKMLILVVFKELQLRNLKCLISK